MCLHQNIQDAFNEFRRRSCLRNYEADPEGPKIVPREKWFGGARGSDPATAVGATNAARFARLTRSGQTNDS